MQRTVLLLILLTAYCTNNQCSYALETEQNDPAQVAHAQRNSLISRKAVLSAHLADAADSLKALLQNDPDGRIKKDLGPLEQQLSCALRVVSTLNETEFQTGAVQPCESDDASVDLWIEVEPLEPIEDLVIVSSRDYLIQEFMQEEALQSPLPVERAESSDLLFLPKLPPLPKPALKKVHESEVKAVAVQQAQEPIDEIGALTSRLGKEFMLDNFYPWYKRNRMRIASLSTLDEFPYSHALLLCVIETSPQSSSSRVRKVRPKRAWRVISTILASGLCDLTDWKLLPHQSWAEPVLTLANDLRVRAVMNKCREGVAKALYTMLSRPHLQIDKRLDLFLYLVDPVQAVRRYAAGVLAGRETIYDSKNQTPLIWAAYFGDAAMVVQILDALKKELKGKGKSARLRELQRADLHGLTALDHACQRRKIDVFEPLMRAGARASRKMLLKLVHKEDLLVLRQLSEFMRIPDEVIGEATRFKLPLIQKLFENQKRIKEEKARLKDGFLVGPDDLYKELKGLPSKLDLADNNGVVAGLYLLGMKGLLDVDDDEETEEN